jgi:uncharacterized BrkB/YihY/UPF0761 family membrane protein
MLKVKITITESNIPITNYYFSQNGIIAVSFLGGLGIISLVLMCFSMFGAFNGKTSKIFKTKLQKFFFWLTGFISIGLIAFILFGFFLAPLCDIQQQSNSDSGIGIYTFSNF